MTADRNYYKFCSDCFSSYTRLVLVSIVLFTIFSVEVTRAEKDEVPELRNIFTDMFEMPFKIYESIFGKKNENPQQHQPRVVVTEYPVNQRKEKKPIEAPAQEPAKEEPSVVINTESKSAEEPVGLTSQQKENGNQEANPEPPERLSSKPIDKKEIIQNVPSETVSETKEQKQAGDSGKEENKQTTMQEGKQDESNKESTEKKTEKENVAAKQAGEDSTAKSKQNAAVAA